MVMLIDAVTKTHSKIILNRNSQPIVQVISGESTSLITHNYPLREIPIIFSDDFYLPVILDSDF
ncbi:hypothetical protein IQ244_21240 [Nostoc sp. LEGE 06077]|uniref:hypothetical protein n=1 Tax=Nostoc sp. LEGE 06077 TaxID=915325 RepID=UPI0018801BB4|nr:hypothetical protein [Nostoc sp. LEGE 06077]MBE9209017.1 hypothetical protein [Nostoc sp. LEGE 06077]